MMEGMRIAVTTPTGNVGRHVLAMLIRAGVRPRVLVRHPDRLDPSVRPLVDVVTVDQFDADTVVAATRDITGLFWVDPTTGGEDPLADYQRASVAVSRAVAENGIDRVVFQSSVGAEKRHGAGEIDGLARTELALDDTDADVTHLRCGYFFSNLELQVDAIRTGTLHVEQIADDAMRAILRDSGMTEGLVEAVIGMSTGLRDGFVPEQPRTLRSTTPTTLASWAYDVLRPRL